MHQNFNTRCECTVHGKRLSTTIQKTSNTGFVFSMNHRQQYLITAFDGESTSVIQNSLAVNTIGSGKVNIIWQHSGRPGDSSFSELELHIRCGKAIMIAYCE